jgi:hypothetical protein
MRAFPGWYQYNSVYALLPLIIPAENKRILTALKKVSLYSFDPPSAPHPPSVLSTAQSARSVLGHPQVFYLVWDKAVSALTGESRSSSQVNPPVDDSLWKKIVLDNAPQGLDEIRNFYVGRTAELLRTRSCPVGTYSQVDIIREYLPESRS